jgi:DNA-binding NarL/FixJ family response regulator
MKKNPPRETKIRVMLVDDHPVMREALRAIITSEPDLAVVAEADGGRAAIDLLGHAKPDVILMDGSMPDMNGIETTRQLRQLQPDVKIIGLTLYEQTTYLEEMVEVGASGYVLKTGAPEDVTKAIRVVTAGGTYFDPSVRRRRVAAEQKRSATGKLTGDELAIAKLLADGQTNAEIAVSLGMTVPVVQAHRAAAMKKLGLRTRAELVRVAAERHWLDA